MSHTPSPSTAPTPTTVRQVTASKNKPTQGRSRAPAANPRLVSVERQATEATDAVKQMQGGIREMQAALERAQAGLTQAHTDIQAMQKDLGQLRLTVPAAKVPVNTKRARALLAANSAQWFEVLRDFKHGHLQCKSTAQICAQHYKDLASFIAVGLQLSPIDDPHAGA